MNTRTTYSIAGLLAFAAAPLAAQTIAPESAETAVRTSKTLQVTADYYNSTSDLSFASDADYMRGNVSDREGDLWGTTVSYGYSPSLFFDVSYFTGDSTWVFFEELTASGAANLGIPGAAGFRVENTALFDENWYEFRARWTPNSFTRGAFRGYISLGLTYIDLDVQYRSTSTLGGAILAEDVVSFKGSAENLFGNLGVGVGAIKPWAKVNVGYKLEGNFLYGERSDKGDLYDPTGTGVIIENVDESDSQWGVLARGTAFVNYPFNGEKFNGVVSLEVGLRAYWWEPSSEDDELSWGPFVKTGLAFYF